MNDEEPTYMSRAQLAARVGVSVRLLHNHEKCNVAGINAARETHKGFGTVFVFSKLRKYLALLDTKRQPKITKPIQAEEVA